MAQLYLDHNVSLHLVDPLRARGHDVVSARDLGLSRLTDDAHLLSAARAGRTLLTHNRRDFTLLHDAWVSWPAAFDLALPPHSGILVLVAAYHTLRVVVETALAATSQMPLNGNLFWWQQRTNWRRRIPEGWTQITE